MAVRIRLRRMGRKKQPHYRVVVADSAKPRDGRFVESLGYYRPLTDPARAVIDLERVDYWLEKGAIPSDTVRSLVAKVRKGGDETLAVGEVDQDEAKARRAEELADRRKAEAALAAEEAEQEVEAEPEPEAEEESTAESEAEEESEAEGAEAEDADEEDDEEDEEGEDEEDEEDDEEDEEGEDDDEDEDDEEDDEDEEGEDEDDEDEEDEDDEDEEKKEKG